jgi:hypothetical protein
MVHSVGYTDMRQLICENIGEHIDLDWSTQRKKKPNRSQPSSLPRLTDVESFYPTPQVPTVYDRERTPITKKVKGALHRASPDVEPRLVLHVRRQGFTHTTRQRLENYRPDSRMEALR